MGHKSLKMTRYTIREVQTKKDLRRFIKFPFELYKGCDQYVPPLVKGQEHELMHAASLKYCTRRMWLAEDEMGKVVGRICAMINPRYNEKYGTKRARFGWFDLINDMDVAKLLFDAAESWAKGEGMDLGHSGDTRRDRDQDTRTGVKERSVEWKISSGKGLQEWSQNSLRRKRA